MDATTGSAVAPPPQSTPGQTQVIDVASLPWQGSGAVQFKVLWRDETSGASTVLFKFAPGAKAPLHEHLGIEQTYVLEGSFGDHDSLITAGNFAVRQAGSVHQGFTEEGSLHLAIFSGPNRLVETGQEQRF